VTDQFLFLPQETEVHKKLLINLRATLLGLETRVSRLSGWVRGRSLVGVAGSNPVGGTDICPCDCCVLSGRGLGVELTTRPEDSY